MSDIAIKVENLGKSYLVGHNSAQAERYTALRDVIVRNTRNLKRKTRDMLAGRAIIQGDEVEEFWALKDVSFEIKRGETVGIIGRNGAGKSTLLKILSRITEPDKGRITINGRVASLLEVGTGFHPELTGRENIFLNGAILGMKRTEIRDKFDEIVSFAELEKFLDTPVKRYSSGMYVRLAFAVAAHLEPEILVVDEVLAVGDAQFQRKCLGKLEQIGQNGRTVLFVSHDMAAIQHLCSTAILLEHGQLSEQGTQNHVVTAYLSKNADDPLTSLNNRIDRKGDGSVRITELMIEDADGNSQISINSRIKITINYIASQPITIPKVLIGLYDLNETCIYGLDSETTTPLPASLPTQGSITCTTAPLNITPGRCFVNIAFFNHSSLSDYIQRAAEFQISSSDIFGTGRTPTRDWTLGVLQNCWLANNNKQ